MRRSRSSVPSVRLRQALGESRAGETERAGNRQFRRFVLARATGGELLFEVRYVFVRIVDLPLEGTPAQVLVRFHGRKDKHGEAEGKGQS
jgi:hypothetical protein